MELTWTRLVDQNFGMCITPQDLIIPYYASIGANYYRPWKWCIGGGIKDCASTIDDQKDIFKITLDVQHFTPNEIRVKIVDKEVIIEGKHEERQDNHGIISRQFKRRYVLPNNCPPELVTSTLSSDGILTVTAGKQTIENKGNEIIVPILMCGPSVKQEQAENNNISANNQKENKDAKNINLDLKTKTSSLKDGLSSAKKDVSDTTTSSADKVLMETKKESDNLSKLTSDVLKISAGSSLTKLENVIEQSKASMDEMMEKISEKNVMNMTETSNFKSTMKETSCLASEEISSFKSSISSSTRVSGEQMSELVSDIISAELKEAAEIV